MTTCRILLATDAWHPQINGVVRTLETTVRLLRDRGRLVEVVEPSRFAGFPFPLYPEIVLSVPSVQRIRDLIRRFAPTHIHIATEGPIGLAVRHVCVRRHLRFTTSYHTNFPEYLQRMLRLPLSLSYAYMRWFHSRSSRIMIATPSLERLLTERGFSAEKCRWSRGVDLDLFYPRPKSTNRVRPILLYVGRVSTEKGIDAFLSLKTAGTKVIVGDGPQRADLQRRFPEAEFLGYRQGAALAEIYADADVFVFPSRTDTFGLVVIEALASGVPVAAHPVMGPIDILTEPNTGALHEDLGVAVSEALRVGDAGAAAALGRRFSWEHCTNQFLTNLVPARGVELSASKLPREPS